MADSSNVHVGPRRLSKPRTIKSSSNLLSEQHATPSSPPNSFEQDYFGRDAVAVNTQGERRSRSKSRSRIRAYLYRSSHDTLQTSSDDEDTHTGIAGAARDVRKRLSRTGSSIAPLQSARASVTRLSNSSSSRLLSTRSTESQRTNPEESAMIADQIKQRAYHDSLAAQNHVSTPVDEDRHVDSIMAPLRRKSLYTPGIATRNASDILRKPPTPLTDHDYYYDPSRPKTSPLSHLAALNASEDGRSTPSDLLQLGGIQLGTLRVTNGTSSPIPGNHHPDLAYRSTTPESKTHDEYYTASEGSVTGDRDHTRGGSPLKFESDIEASMRADTQVPSSPDKSLPFERESSNESFPFSRETAEEAVCSERETPGEMDCFKKGPPNESSPFRKESSTSRTIGERTPNRSFPFESETSNESFRTKQESYNQTCAVEGNSPNGASDIADEYIAELDGSPFSHPSLEDKRHFMPQSQHPVEEMWSSSINNAKVQHDSSVIGSREDAFRKLTVNGHMPSTWQPKRLSVPSSRPSRYSASPEMPQTDSGYCSHASLTGAAAHDVDFETRNTPVPATKASVSPPPQAAETVRSSARSSFGIPLRKLQKQRPKSQPPPVNFISVQQCHEFTDAHIPRVPSIIAARHADRLRQFPLLEHTFQSSQHTTADRPVSSVQAHDAPIRFPSPATALEAVSAPSKLHPTASFKHRASTIVVDDNEWGASDLVRSPSWSEFGGGKRKKQQKKLAKEDKQSEKRLQKGTKEERSARSRSASRTRGSSQHDPLVTIADFGTVTESLGNSPYDIATAMSKPPNVSQIAGNWHPHQMSTAMPRPKSMFGMDEAAATDFGHARSRNRSQSFGRPSALASSSIVGLSGSNLASSMKSIMPAPKAATPLDNSPGMPIYRISGDRHHEFRGGIHPQSECVDAPSVPALAAVDFRAHDIKWARDRQRSQSLSAARAESFKGQGEIPGVAVRSSVMMDDPPPVPALPSTHQVKQREAEIMRSRPQSMMVEAPVPIPTSSETEQRKAISYPREPGASATGRKTKGSKIVPDLWSNGSLERKSPKTHESNEGSQAKDHVWESQSNAWSQRRKSAGEALLKNQVREILDGREAANPGPLDERGDRPPFLARTSTSGAYQTFMPSPSHLGPWPNPLASHPQLTALQPTYASNTPFSLHQSASQQTQQPGFSPLASPPRSSVSSSQQTPTSILRRAQTQSFQIPRKRVGSGPSILRNETAIGSSRYEAILI